jgi:DNA polymerase I-like protein with 3'-5' exonuclease and polymerase domains
MQFVAIDIETTGLHPSPLIISGPHTGRPNKIFCLTINTGGSIQLVEDMRKVKPILEDKTICKVIHNAQFDSFWLKRLHNIEVRNIWDTRIMEQVIIGDNLPRSVKDEELRKEMSSSLLYTLERYGLATLENKHIGADFAKKNPNAKLTPQEIDYAKNDVKYLLHLQAMQERRLIKLDLMRVANLENKLVEVLVRMRDRGLGFNEKTWREIAKSNETQYNHLLKKLPPVVSNWNSPQQVKKFFNSRGIPVESLTGIEDLAEFYNDPVLNQFIEMRSLFKSTTTYGTSWLTDSLKGNTVDGDGRVRTDIEQIINTGRMASSHPNLNQLPREGLHRSAFIPKKGNVFIIGDYSSQEIGIAAAASGEKLWIDAILRREDVHSLTASIISQDEWIKGTEKGCTFPKKCKCKVHQARREDAKITNFTILYGGGPLNVSKKTKKTLKEATKLVYKFKRTVPKLTKWLENNAKESIKTRMSYSADPFKRRRTLRDPEDWMLSNIGKNNPIQACGANMLKLAMVSMSENIWIVLPTHDELAIEVPKKDAKKAMKELKTIMEKAADYCTGIPGLIKVEPRIALNLLKI